MTNIANSLKGIPFYWAGFTFKIEFHEEQSVRKKKQIFICVEDPFLQFTLVMILKREGYQVVSKTQSQMADFWVFDEPVDLLILDKSDRWDDIWNQKLSKIRCHFAHQPILILSSHLPGPKTFDCEDFGFCKVIQKPAEPLVILKNARELLTLT